MMNSPARAALGLSAATLLVLSGVLSGCGGGGTDSPADETAAGTAAQDSTPSGGDVADGAKGDDAFTADATEATAKANADLDQQISVSPSSFYSMVKGLGGYAAYEKLMDSGDTAAIDAIHEAYGVSRSSESPEALDPQVDVAGILGSRAVTDREDCPQFFPAVYRDKLYTLNGHRVYIDKQGRPGYAYRGFPAKSSRPTSMARTTCQTTVGTWGIRGSDPDIGGHLIPDVLGGWPGRANIVPQNWNMNLSTWRIVENATVACAGGKLTTVYNVVPVYDSTTTVRPSKLAATWTAYVIWVGITLPGGKAYVTLVNRHSSPSAYTAAYQYRDYLAPCNK